MTSSLEHINYGGKYPVQETLKEGLKETAAPDRGSAFNAVVVLPARTVNAIFMGNICNVYMVSGCRRCGN